MSPEQCSGRGNIDARSDIYALGIVMYEMLTGHVPFKGEGFGDIVVAHLTETAKKPSELRADVPPALDAIVMKAIAKEVDARFQSMEEFGVALSDPEAFSASPTAVAQLGAVAAAATASVPVIVDVQSGPTSASTTDAATIIAAKKKADTTLSGAASESAVREPAAAATTARAGGGRRVAVIGATAVAVAAVAVVALVKLGGGSAATTTTPPTPTVTTPAPLPAAAPIAAVTTPKPIERVEVALKSDPVGAKVVRTDGVVVGVTPVTMKLDKGSAPFEVQLELEGYRAEKRTITADLNRELDVNLLKAPSSSRRAAKAVSEAERAEAERAEARRGEAGAGQAGAGQAGRPRQRADSRAALG